MSQQPVPANRPEQFPPMTALTSMFPIHIGSPDPAKTPPAKPAGRNAERAPVRHDPK